jgi:MoxR-like ATPase
VQDPAGLARLLAGAGYFADEGVATAAYLALALPRPLFLEGEAGVGKTALAHALASVVGAELLRLQCYEGIDASQALYDWDFPRQLLHLRAAESAGAASGAGDADRLEHEVYSRRFLLARPLLAALETSPAVLLVDEVDRADDEFEAFLLEVLSDYTVTCPSSARSGRGAAGRRRHEQPHARGARRAQAALPLPLGRAPALRPRGRDRPGPRAGGVRALAAQVASAVAVLRSEDLLKPPGVAETIDWTMALVALGADRLDADTATATLGAVLKYREDQLHASRLDVQKMIATAVAGG